MKIIQIAATVSHGDGVSNDILALYHTISQMGYQTAVYAENISETIFKYCKTYKYFVRHISYMPKLEDQDIIIYHLSIGTRLNYELGKYKGRKVIVYHNITPPDFFRIYSKKHFRQCLDGLNGMRYLAKVAEYCLADSEFNKQELIEAGYKCNIDILPILIQFKDYSGIPDQKIIDKYTSDDYINLLFVGRVAPNKKQEDIISTFYQFQSKYHAKARLFLVGSYQDMKNYYYRLLEYVDELEVKEVYFIGHVKFNEIIAYYHIADAFVCMSEHEGFCIPLIEAMYFNLPILAYDSSAVAGTLGGSGFLTNTKDPLVNASILNRIFSDQELKEKICENERERLKEFSNIKIEKLFEEYINTFIAKC